MAQGIRVIVLAAAVGFAARADVLYSSQAAFAAATSNPSVIGFNGILAPGQSFSNFNPLIVDGINFSTPNSGTSVNVTTADYYGPGFNYPADFIVNSANPGDNELDVVFAAPTNAFALNFGGFGGGGLGRITLSDGTVFNDPSLPSVGNTAFVGFVTNTPVTSFSFVASNDAWVVEDLTLATTVPEPASWVFLVIGTTVLLATRRRWISLLL